MTLAFQDSLLKYLFQDKQSKRYKDYLDQSVFDIPTFQLVYGFWYDYVTKYNSIPSKSNFLEFVDRAVRRAKGAVTDEVYDEIRNAVAIVYTQDDNDYEFTKEVIIEFAKKKNMRNLITNKADKIKNATTEELDDISNQMRTIVNMGADLDAKARNNGGLLFRDGGKDIDSSVMEGAPTFLHGINKTTAARGFYSPQLILLMGGPKAFKTGTLLSIMIEYARAGKKVYIADFENGLNSIKTRLKQGLLECERHEVFKYRSELKSIYKMLRAYGGDLATAFYPAGLATLDDVDADIERLVTEQGWKPDVILYDYLRLAKSANKKVVDPRLQLAEVFHHAVRLNNKYNMFAFTPTKVKQEAVNKLIIKPTDFGEDFAQAYNCHATFALCRTEDEEREGNGRIITVLQREGMQYRFGAATTCAIKIQPEIQTITELDAEAYMAVLEEEQATKNKPNHRRSRVINLKDLSDD